MNQEVMNEFFKAWDYLSRHPIFQKIEKPEDRYFEKEWLSISTNKFNECFEIHVVYVNPLTKDIDSCRSKNTMLNIWLEVGPYNEQFKTHDVDLNCGGDTFEEAIIELAKLVKQKYGDDREKALKIVRGANK